MSTVDPTDIRQWTRPQRKALCKGERIRIRADPNIIVETAKPILLVTSTTAHQLIVDSVIMLTDDVDQASVLRLVRHVEHLATSEAQPLRMANDMDVLEMLRVTAAAQALGMEKYTAHVYKKVEAQLRHGLLEYDDLDAILSLKVQHQRLFRIVCENLARRVREETIPDHDVLDRYLEANPLYRDRISSLNDTHANRLRIAQEREHRIRQAEQARIRREETKECAIADANAREKREAARTQPAWDKKAAQETEYERICIEQSRLPVNKRKKFTNGVRLHWERTQGTKPPKGC
jgi:hypothetical protein